MTTSIEDAPSQASGGRGASGEILDVVLVLRKRSSRSFWRR